MITESGGLPVSSVAIDPEITDTVPSLIKMAPTLFSSDIRERKSKVCIFNNVIGSNENM